MRSAWCRCLRLSTIVLIIATSVDTHWSAVGTFQFVPAPNESCRYYLNVDASYGVSINDRAVAFRGTG